MRNVIQLFGEDFVEASNKGKEAMADWVAKVIEWARSIDPEFGAAIGGLALAVEKLFTGTDFAKIQEELKNLQDMIAKTTKEIEDGVFAFKKLSEINKTLADDLDRINATLVVMGDAYDPVNDRVQAYQQHMIELVLIMEKNRKEVDRFTAALEKNGSLSKVDAKSLKAAQDQLKMAEEALKLDKLNIVPLEQEQKIKQVFQAISDSVTGSINQMVRGVLQGTQSVSDAFANMAENIILSLTSDLLNHAIAGFLKQLGALAAQSAASGFGGLFGGGASTPPTATGQTGVTTGNTFFSPSGAVGKAAGGPLGAGQLAVVGEKGPELFMSRSPGTVIPNKAFGNSMTVNIINNGSAEIETQERSDPFGGRTLDVMISDTVANDAQNNGRAMQSILSASGLRRAPKRR
jgi:hypothetical protein